jgi:hypothetical protein
MLVESFVGCMGDRCGDMTTIQMCIEIFVNSSFFTDLGQDRKRDFAATFLNLYTADFRKQFELKNVVLEST